MQRTMNTGVFHRRIARHIVLLRLTGELIKCLDVTVQGEFHANKSTQNRMRTYVRTRTSS